MMNEVNKLIWPSDGGIGYIDQAAWDRTVEISQSTPNLEGATVLTAPPTDGAFTNDIVEAAWALLGDADLKGETSRRPTSPSTPAVTDEEPSCRAQSHVPAD